jgi:hypothetical protein
MFTLLFLIGVALFAASMVLEKSAALDAEGGPAGIVIPLRAWGVVAATAGLVSVMILTSVNGGFFSAGAAV